MTRRSLALVAALSLHALSLSLVTPLAVAHASPGIRRLDPSEIDRVTDLRARVRVLAVERTRVGRHVEVRSVVEVLSTTGRRARVLRRGARVTFSTSCEEREVPLRMSGYPNAACSSGWWQMPQGLTQRGQVVELPLSLGRDDHGHPTFGVVVGTWPAVGHAFGQLGDLRVNRFSSR